MVKPPEYSAKVQRDNTLYMKSASTELQEEHVLVEDIVEHIYPSHVNPVSSEVATDLLKYLLEPKNFQGTQRKDVIDHLTDEKNHSKSTIQNKVIPMLKRRGVIKSSKDRGMYISNEFSRALEDIAGCWRTIIKRQKKLSNRG